MRRTSTVLLVLESGQRVVLRRFSGPRWSTAGPGAAVNEAKVLKILEGSAVPAPRLLAVDAAGERCGTPSVLMEFMPGRRMLLPDMNALVTALARAMAAIHDVTAPAVASLPDETAAILRELDRESAATDEVQHPGLEWQVVSERRPSSSGDGLDATLWQLVGEQWPPLLATSSHLIHNDFSTSNLLFVDGHLTAVLDWEDSARGHLAYDVSFCRMSTALTLGVEVGDLVKAAYEAEVGAPVENLPWWDLVAAARLQPDLGTWTASDNFLGSPDLTIPEVVRRFDLFVQSARAAL